MEQDFSHLKQYEVNGVEPVRLELDMIRDAPVLHLLPATRHNKPFLNAAIASKNGKTKMTDLELIGTHCLPRWEGVRNRKGEEVDCTPENAVAYLRALPDWIFERVAKFVAEPSNFAGELDEESVTEAAGNS